MIPVMIVEDEFLVRVGLRSMIDWEKHGFCVVADAPNGERGLALFKEYRPYLILTDIKMSPMDGLQMMKEIRGLDEDARFIVISAYDEFKYAQEAIRQGVELYLNKASFTNQEIVPVLERIRSQYEKSHAGARESHTVGLPDFFPALPERGDTPQMERWMSSLGMLDKEKVLAACRYDKSSTVHENWNLVTTVLSDLLDGSGLNHRLYRSNDFLVALVDHSCPQTVEDCFAHIGDTLKKYANSHLYFGFSMPFTDGQRIYHALSEACRACNEFFFDKTVVIRRYDPQREEGAKEEALRLKCEEMEAFLLSDNQEKALELLRQMILFAQNYRNLEHTVFTLLLTLEKYDRSLMVNDMLASAMKCDDPERLYNYLANWIRNLRFEKKEGRNGYVEEIIGYLQEHLDEDLSLKTLAARYHLSPNYLGKLFFQQTGVYLTNYVSNCRINKACELVRDTDLSMGEVGQRVGIEDPHYFSRLFKEKMGVSPYKYRNQGEA